DDTDRTFVATAVLTTSAYGSVDDFVQEAALGDEPMLVRPGSLADPFYLSWRTAATPGDPAGEDVWVRELIWNSDQLHLEAQPDRIALPRWPADQVADQRQPRLADTPLGPHGAIFAGWDDFSGQQAEVRLELIPLPILRKAF